MSLRLMRVTDFDLFSVLSAFVVEGAADESSLPMNHVIEPGMKQRIETPR